MNDMGSVWPLILTSINDTVDDVRAVTATCLLPVVDKLPAIMPYQVCLLLRYLWICLQGYISHFFSAR